MGNVSPGSWTPYSVTVGNEGGVDVVGEVVLTAQPEPPPKPGASPPVVTTTVQTTSTVLTIGGKVVTAPPPSGPGSSTALAPWPSYRVPVSVPVGTEKTLSVLVLQAPFGFAVRLMGRGGRVLAAAPGPFPVAREHLNVLLLSGVVGADAVVETLPQLVAPNLEVTQLRDARDFPDMALHLTGLGAVILDDFGTATLSPRQRRALEDYVSLGGSLVLTGGTAWSRTLEGLPPGMAPLRASAAAPTSLAPLADLLAGTTTVTAPVATGELTGRVLVAAPGGPPLVVESDYRAGQVIQLTYDPLAEPITSDQALHSVAWN